MNFFTLPGVLDHTQRHLQHHHMLRYKIQWKVKDVNNFYFKSAVGSTECEPPQVGPHLFSLFWGPIILWHIHHGSSSDKMLQRETWFDCMVRRCKINELYKTWQLKILVTSYAREKLTITGKGQKTANKCWWYMFWVAIISKMPWD